MHDPTYLLALATRAISQNLVFHSGCHFGYDSGNVPQLWISVISALFPDVAATMIKFYSEMLCPLKLKNNEFLAFKLDVEDVV